MNVDSAVYAERAVLGICMMDRDSMLDSTSILTEEDFSTKATQLVFRAVKRAAERGTSGDAVDVIEILNGDHTLESVGGVGFVKNLVANVDDIANYRDYITVIRERSSLRRLDEACHKITDQIKKGGIDNIPEFISNSRNMIAEVAEKQQVGGFRSVSQMLDAVLGGYEEESRLRREKGTDYYVTGVSSGYRDFDRITSGFHKGELIIMGARPSVGKTALAINMALNAAKNVPVAFFSLEMDAISIIRRMLSNTSYLSADEVRDLDLVSSTDERGRHVFTLPPSKRTDPDALSHMSFLQKGLADLRQREIYIDDRPGTTVNVIRNKIHQLQTKVPTLGLVVIDYLTMIVSAGAKVNSQDSRATVVGDISRALKNVARDMSIPLLVLSQFSRDPDKRTGHHEPTISDLRDSGNIEQDADQIYLLYRPDYYDDGKSKDEDGQKDLQVNQPISQTIINIAKNRNGPTGKLTMSFDKPRCIFTEIADENQYGAGEGN